MTITKEELKEAVEQLELVVENKDADAYFLKQVVSKNIDMIKDWIDEEEDRRKDGDSRGFKAGVAWAAALHGEFGGCNTKEFITEAGYRWEDLEEAAEDWAVVADDSTNGSAMN